MGWRKDLGICLRWDVNRSMTLKGEWHAIDGAALFVGVYNMPWDSKTGLGKTALTQKMDNRVLTKQYGRAFLDALPKCPVEIV